MAVLACAGSRGAAGSSARLALMIKRVSRCRGSASDARRRQALVAQLAEAPASNVGGSRFESGLGYVKDKVELPDVSQLSVQEIAGSSALLHAIGVIVGDMQDGDQAMCGWTSFLDDEAV